ncbi:MAG: MlaE family lipid ABC transporter permease subunit [Xanthobacteraceae bacterium]|nr:MlaE family lipid ABC transporter permease subunit [Xanthobacteraceae bacterium]
MALIDEPLLRSATLGDRLQLAAAGSWTAPHAADLEALIDDAVARGRKLSRVELNMAAVENLDTFGAWLLERLLRGCAEAGRGISVTGLPDRFHGIINEAHQSNRTSAEQPHEGVVGSAVAGTKRALATITQDVVLNVAMFGALVFAAMRVVVKPGSLRLTSVVHHLDRVCWKAVPIVLLITVLIGAIIAQQGIFHFRRFGAEVYVVDMLGILVMREIGVLIVAIMIAGRSGSAYTAELGAMKMREEIDALHTMGLDPIDVLVLPRVLALVIALPILTFLGSMAALYGGGMVCWLYAGMSPDIFLGRLREIISIDHFEVGMSKAPFMALVIGIVASVEGMQVKGSAESLGLQTTASVVKSIFLVIVLDGIFAMFFAAIGK